MTLIVPPKCALHNISQDNKRQLLHWEYDTGYEAGTSFSTVSVRELHEKNGTNSNRDTGKRERQDKGQSVEEKTKSCNL